jgi:transcriptional regulator with XRE-family HTH domain
MACLSAKTMAHMEIAARFGENLARCRKAAGISQEELGFLASLHRTEIGMLERGARLARLDTLIKLRGALGVSADDLLDGLDWTPSDPRIGQFTVRDDSPELN